MSRSPPRYSDSTSRISSEALSKSRNRHRDLSALVLERDRSRRFRNNDSLSGSRTRSSSRTTSGNPDSSPSRSYSPSPDRASKHSSLPDREDSQPFKAKRRRFLQRWEEAPVPRGTDEEEENDKLPYVFQQAEFIRIARDILFKLDSEDLLLAFLKVLDEGKPVNLMAVPDPKFRKKLRHISKALYLDRNHSFLTKPKECNTSLVKIYKDLLPFISTNANAKADKARASKSDLEEEDVYYNLLQAGSGNSVSSKSKEEEATASSKPSIRTEEVDLWGKSVQEQKRLLARKDNPEAEEEEQPWRVFDRERDLVATSKLSSRDYKSVVENAKDFVSNFKSTSKTTSFI